MEGGERVVPVIGSQVASYRIDALVGRGGGGVVYRATHLRLRRTVALKLLAPELAADPEFQRRFEREALMAGALDHPHIIPVYDAGEAGGVLYLAMRFVEGSDLDTMIETNGRLDPKRACTILGQVASALDAAHEKSLVHRDVKPGNILIDHGADAGRAEHVYLSDFGLTRRFAGTGLSVTTVAGTPWYMAPERFRGVPAAPAIDVYALGCVAYACLIGSPPFIGDNIESVMAGHLYEPPPKISAHRADLPAGVDAILAKAIAKEPADRYPSCGAFATALHDEIHAGAVASQPPGKPPPGTSRRRKIVGAAAVAAVLVAALVALAVWIAPGQPSATATRLTGTVNAFAIDPAGDVYLGTFGDSRIFKVEPSGTIRTVAGTGTKGYSGDDGPATKAQLWNPQGLAVDGKGNLYIADTYNHRIRKIDSAGTITTIAGNGTQDSTGDGGPATLAQFGYPRALVVDDLGNLYIADAGNHRIRKVDTAGTITSVAGNGTQGFAGDGGLAAVAELGDLQGVAVDRAGSLYIADAGNDRIRKVDASGRISTVAGSGTRGFSGDGGPAAIADLAAPNVVAVDRTAASTSVILGATGSARSIRTALSPPSPARVQTIPGMAAPRPKLFSITRRLPRSIRPAGSTSPTPVTIGSAG